MVYADDSLFALAPMQIAGVLAISATLRAGPLLTA